MSKGSVWLLYNLYYVSEIKKINHENEEILRSDMNSQSWS